jgi:hypothetical protein
MSKNQQNSNKNGAKVWDVAVIGGGPAGMMAAGRAAELGARVLLLEKNKTLGKKLLITGGGRCNLTNAELNNRVFLSKFKESDKFLFSPFSQMDVEKTISFFHKYGCPTKIEAGGRVFPISDKSQSVLDALLSYMRKGKVTIHTDAAVEKIDIKNNNLAMIHLKNKSSISAKKIIIATGGMSRPETGSTGDGFHWLASLGHTIKKSDPSLVPIALQDAWIKTLQGVTLDAVKINVVQNEKKQFSKTGRILFTHFGVSGPTIINMSKNIRDLLEYGPVTLSVDLFPNENHGELKEKINTLFAKEQNKKIKNVISSFLPATALQPIILAMTHINPDVFCHSITREERTALITLLKGIPMQVKGILGKDKAIVTSGGVPLSEIETKTMQSKIVSNVYLTGDVLDIDRPSGGYSLQLCWTTGYVAGSAAAAALKKAISLIA